VGKRGGAAKRRRGYGCAVLLFQLRYQLGGLLAVSERELVARMLLSAKLLAVGVCGTLWFWCWSGLRQRIVCVIVCEIFLSFCLFVFEVSTFIWYGCGLLCFLGISFEFISGFVGISYLVSLLESRGSNVGYDSPTLTHPE